MELSRTQALDLLIKWESNSTELFVVCEWQGRGSLLQTVGRIGFVSANRFEVVWDNGSFLFWMPINTPEDVVFKFAEPVEAPPILERLHRERYVCSLDVWRPPNERFVLYELFFPTSLLDVPENRSQEYGET